MRLWPIPCLLGALCCAPAAVAQQLGQAAHAVLVAPGLTSRTVEITDEFRDFVRRSIGTTSRVYADVSAVSQFHGSACKRIAVVIRAPDAVAVDPATGQKAPFRFEYAMNLCPDGHPPGAK